MNLRSSGRPDLLSPYSAVKSSLKIKSKQDKSKNQLCHQSPGYKFISTKARAEEAANPSQTRCVGLARHTLTKAATVEGAVIFPATLPEAEGARRGRYEGRKKLAVSPGLGCQDPSTTSLPPSAAPTIYRHGRLQARPPEPSGLPPRPHARQPPSPRDRSVCGFTPASGFLGNTHLPAKSL